MEDFNMVGSMEKLNEYNYRDWKTCMKFYLKGHNLWEIVDGNQTSPPNKDDKSYESWNVKANKAMYILVTSMEKNVRSRIAHVETPKEAWDILASLFSNKSTARLQLLEKEVMNTTQGTLSIKEYFTKVKKLCREIEEIDDEAKFGDGRIRRIIINGLNSEYNSFIAAIQGWQTQPSLVELENLLVDQEALSQRMSKVTIKSETEEALFSARRPSRKFKKGDCDREHNRGKPNHRVHKSDSEDEQESDKEDRRQHRYPKWGECFICGQKGHYARDCKYLKKIQSNFVKIEHKDDPCEEEWDFEATYAVEEDASNDEVFDFEATYAVEDDVTEEEDWDLLGKNDELWIEELETEDNPKIAVNTVIGIAFDDQHENDMTTKIEHKDHVVINEENDGFILSQEEIELVATRPGVQMQGEPNDIVQTKEIEDANKGLKEEESMVMSRIENEENDRDDRREHRETEDHSKMSQNHSTQYKARGKLTEGKYFDQDKFNIGASIKRPPDKEEQLGIKGEY